MFLAGLGEAAGLLGALGIGAAVFGTARSTGTKTTPPAGARRRLSTWVAGWSTSKNRTDGRTQRTARESWPAPAMTTCRTPLSRARATAWSKNAVRAARKANDGLRNIAHTLRRSLSATLDEGAAVR
jgi:hypothetical protein